MQPRRKQKEKGRKNVIKDKLDIEEQLESLTPAKKDLRLKQDSQTRHEAVIARIHRIRHSISASTL